ncbi:MAG: DUF393 domain-containing protein [Chloroflexi bacterium]|nr:DUF393 domain-containing protein [Chloroflexota bacterium]
MPEFKQNKGQVIFDGECGACRALKEMAAKYDTRRKLEFIPSQSAELESISPHLTREMTGEAFYFVAEDGRIFRESRAVFEVMKHMSGLWAVLGRVLSLPGITLLADPLYRLFARHRHSISKQLRLED